MSKGSKQRPTNHEAYATAWDKIFKKEHSSDTQGATNAEAVMPVQSTQTGAIVSSAATLTAQETYTNLVKQLNK